MDEFQRSPNNELPSYVGNDEDNCYQRCRLSAIYERCNCTPYYFQSFRGKALQLLTVLTSLSGEDKPGIEPEMYNQDKFSVILYAL